MRISLDNVTKWSFGLALVILSAIGVFSYRSETGFIESSRRVSSNYEVIETLEDLTTEVVDVESAARGYVVAGEDFYLDPYYSALKDVDQTIGRLKKLTADNARQRARVAAIEGPISEKLAYEARMIGIRRAQGIDAVSADFRLGAGHQLMDRIRDAINTMEAEEKSILLHDSNDARQRGGKSSAALLCGMLTAFAILFAVYYQLTRQIARRRQSELKLIQSNRLYAVLSHVSQAVVRVRERGALFQEVCRVAVEQGGFRMASIRVPEAGARTLKPVAWCGSEAGIDACCGLPEGVAGHFVSNRIETGTSPWEREAFQLGYRSVAAFPIRDGDRAAGSFIVCASEPDIFDEETVRLLEEVTSDVGFALEMMEQDKRRQRAEQETQDLNEKLEHRVLERTVALDAANKELAVRNEEVERANRLKSEFLARMSHELRTPMNAIIGFSDLLAEEADGSLNENYRRYVNHIRQGARHLLELINDVLDLSKIEAGRLELRHEEFYAAEALAEILSVIRPLAEAKRINVGNDVRPELLVYADRTRFKQILYNLLSNAVKFTPEDGHVRVESSWQQGAVAISVNDTGIGISPSEHAAIFTEFHQAGPTPKGVKEGTGLGLAITRRLVELHGGHIGVASEPGKGSSFTFTLPAGCAALEPPGTPWQAQGISAPAA